MSGRISRFGGPKRTIEGKEATSLAQVACRRRMSRPGGASSTVRRATPRKLRSRAQGLAESLRN